MAVRLLPRSFALTPIAATGDGRFGDFRPYVASVADDGTVAFQAALVSGGSGVFSGDGGPVRTHLEPTGGVIREAISHPDIDRAGSLSVYAERPSGERGVYRLHDGGLIAVAETPAFEHIGPLGPTMNAHAVAFRATRDRAAGLYVGDGRPSTCVAETGTRFAAFEGLPVITRAGCVVFRAELAAGGQGIYRWDDGQLETIAETGPRFAELGRFPAANDGGAVVFSATESDGTTGIFAATDGAPEAVVDTRAPFESFRGALVDDGGAVVFYATPRGGRLGIYSGADPVADRVLGIGDALAGATVAGFVLNPVSINARGQLAIRVELDDGRQLIVRADPSVDSHRTPRLRPGAVGP